MNITPLYDQILVRRDNPNAETSSGIILPDVAQKKEQTGTVLACGCGRETDKGVIIPMSLKPGDRVMFSEWAGKEVIIDDETYLIMSEYDCFGTIN